MRTMQKSSTESKQLPMQEMFPVSVTGESMREYGELRYLDILNVCHFETTKGIQLIKDNEIIALNKLARYGWRVINSWDGKHLLERVKA